MANNASNIELNVKVKNEELNNLTDDLAKTRLETQQLKTEIKALEKATQGGTRATQEQTKELVQHYKALEKQEAISKSLKSSIKDLRQEIKGATEVATNADGGVAKLAKSFGLAEGFTTTWSVALGRVATDIATTVVTALGEMAYQVVDLGAKMQQSVAHLAAMTGSVQMATEAQRALNDVYRNTNFQEEAVMNMGEQLMRMGYSAQNAAGLIQLCADAAAGLGTGQQGAQQLVDAISRMQAVGELTSKQMVGLKMAGVDMDAAFKSLGMNGEQAMKAVENGTLDTQQAIGALTDYLHQYDGKMAESKNNTIDAWGDVTGNLQTFCAEIGNSIFDAFNQSEIVQKLIDFTQSLVDMVRSDATGAFTDLKAIAGEVLDFLGGLLGFVLDTIKLIIIILHDAYAAFKSFGAQVVEAIRPAVDAVMALYNAVKAVMSSIGKNFGSEVGKSWGLTFGAPAKRGSSENNFRQRSYGGGGGGRSGGGGGGGAAKALSEEEKAIEAVVKKYADAEKQKWNLAKATLELAKVNMAMLVGEEKETEAQRIKLAAITDAHDKLIEGYNNELHLAEKITDSSTREKTIKSIQDQIDAENQLYEARTKATLFEGSMKDLQEQSKTILDAAFGEPDDIRPKIEKIKEDLVTAMQDVDAAVANPDPEAQLNGLAKILQTTPEALAEELATKNQSIADFAEKYKTTLAEVAAAEVNAEKNAKTWAENTVKYATQVGMSMANAMTDFIMGEKSAKEAMADFVKGILKSAVQILTQWLSLFAIFSLVGDPTLAARNASAAVFGTDGGKVMLRKAMGGYISGPGTGTSDSIPAMLSNGEYVLRSSAVDRIGIGTLNAMNAGAVPHFADGGSVDDTIAASAGVGNVALSVSAVDAASFSDFLDRGGLDKIKQALFEDDRRFSSAVGVW